eukprot:augustus_masked-scaffold_24-processed-gene-4.39-mRNA-1 protein AED:1.00 eAED:1.00 QI:0/0/0/0/1/1/5/0/633
MIAKNIDFQVGMREENAVAIMFTKVKKLLALMPESCAKSKKKIALAILKKLPKYFWVSSEDLILKPELLELDHKNLQNYLLQCIPPSRNTATRKDVETNYVDVDQSMAQPSVLTTVSWKCDAKMSFRCKGEKLLVDGMLDSGTGITAEPRWLVEKMCEKCLLVEGVKLWSKLLIGFDILERHGIIPMQMLFDKIKTKQTDPIEVNATQLETKKSTRELSDWFISSFTSSKNKSQQDLDIQITEAEMEQSEKEPYVIKRRALFRDEAVTFDPQEDSFVDDDLDIGGNLDVNVEEDVARLRHTLQDKVNQNKDKYMYHQWREKFLKLFLNNAEAFGDDLNPTRILTLKPIKCTLIPNADVGVRKSHPMGPEKEDFLRLQVLPEFSEVRTLITTDNKITGKLKTLEPNTENVVKILWKLNSFYELDENFLLVSNQGSHFMNQVVDLFLKQSGGARYFTCAYARFTNGSIEMQNRTILKHIRSLLSEFGLPRKSWPDVVDRVQYFLNANPMRLRGNLTPLQIIMGKEPGENSIGKPMGLDFTTEKLMDLNTLVEELMVKLEKYQVRSFKYATHMKEDQNARYNDNVKTGVLNFATGEYVMMSKPVKYEKVKPQWVGPYQAVKTCSEHVYLIRSLDGD